MCPLSSITSEFAELNSQLDHTPTDVRHSSSDLAIQESPSIEAAFKSMDTSQSNQEQSCLLQKEFQLVPNTSNYSLKDNTPGEVDSAKEYLDERVHTQSDQLSEVAHNAVNLISGKLYNSAVHTESC